MRVFDMHFFAFRPSGRESFFYCARMPIILQQAFLVVASVQPLLFHWNYDRGRELRFLSALRNWRQEGMTEPRFLI